MDSPRRIVELLAPLTPAERKAVLGDLPPEVLKTIWFNWKEWARPEQLAPLGRWSTWVICAGRGFGKTRTGAEWVRDIAESHPRCRIALVAPTAADARQVMVEGESGLLAICPPDKRPTYEPTKRELHWPNGAMAVTYSADEPERLRGPQHDFAWCDELGSWRYPIAWDMLQFGMRLGKHPQVVVTTTPKPTLLMRSVLYQVNEDGGYIKGKDGKALPQPDTVVTSGSTFDNMANLPESFRRQIVRKYEGTRLGRQELYAELLEDVQGALWAYSTIDQSRAASAPDLDRIVVAIDPAVSAETGSDETGLIVAGKARVEGVWHGFVLADLSCKESPQEWARIAIDAFDQYQGDRIVAEVNQGGDMVESTLRTQRLSIPFTAVRASKGKILRAEPVAALYEQGRVHHVGLFPKMEDQMCTWMQGGKSPDRLDALVWAMTELLLGDEKQSFIGTAW